MEYDPDVDVDGLEETQPYLIEYLEEEIPIANSPIADILKKPPASDDTKEIEKPIKNEVQAKARPQAVMQQRPIIKTIVNHQPIVRNNLIVNKLTPQTVKNQSLTNHQNSGKNTVSGTNVQIVKSQSALKVATKPNIQVTIKKHTPTIVKEVPKPILKVKKEKEKSAKKPTDPPKTAVRRNPPRDIKRRRYTTTELDYLESDSVIDDDDDELKIKKRRLTFTQQQKSLADSLGMDEDGFEDDVQVPTSTSTHKTNLKSRRKSSIDEEAPAPVKPIQLAEAQALYFRDKNIREEKKEQREAEEHKLKMKKLWLEVRKTLLEINAMESDNLDAEQ